MFSLRLIHPPYFTFKNVGLVPTVHMQRQLNLLEYCYKHYVNHGVSNKPLTVRIVKES